MFGFQDKKVSVVGGEGAMMTSGWIGEPAVKAAMQSCDVQVY